MQSKPSAITNFLEANLDQNIRAAIFSLPLFVLWIVGLTFENAEAPYKAARRSMFLSLVFLALTGLFYFSHGFVRYFSTTAEIVSGYLFFSLQALNVLAYVLISLWLAFQAYKNQSASIAAVEKNSGRMESFLSR